MAQSYLLQRTFENRRIDPLFLQEMESVTDGEFLSGSELCAALHRLYLEQKHLVFLFDFDMDGIACGVTGFAGLAELGFRVSLFFLQPSDGYGFDASVIERLCVQYPDVDAILTADVGISAFAGIQAAKRRGIQVLVTDHHRPQRKRLDSDAVDSYADVLPLADAVVDPMREDDAYANPHVCGAYVLYRCLMQYARQYRDRMMQEQIRRLSVFAGIGTVSDGMPLYHENRGLVRDAVSVARLFFANKGNMISYMGGCEIYRRAFYGLHCVLTMLQEQGVISDEFSITEDLFGFYLAPMFNSVKRMGGLIERALGVFFGADPQSDAAYLYELNQERKTLVSEAMDAVAASDQPFAPYVYVSDAPAGVLGLLAQKLMAGCLHPVLVVHPDQLSGSGRSPFWYPFLTRGRGHVSFAAGHDAAFGVGFSSAEQVAAYVGFVRMDAADVYRQMPEDAVQTPYDFVIDCSGQGDVGIDILAFLEYLDELEEYRPFGSGFPAPRLLFRFRKPDVVHVQVIGKAKQHLKVTFKYGFELLLWNQAEFGSCLESLDDETCVSVTGSLGVSVYMGMYTVHFAGTVLTAADTV